MAITIGFTRKTASEKNALDFAKELGLLTPHMKALGEIRKGMLQNDGELNRRKAAEYMASLSDLSDPTADGGSKAADAKSTSNPGVSNASGEQPASDSSHPKTDDPSAEAQTKQGNQNNPAAGAQVDDTAKTSDAPKATETEKSCTTVPQTQGEIDWNNRQSAFALLNALESCANAVRYEIYDEDFIYNIYGSHFIEWYELCYAPNQTTPTEAGTGLGQL